MEQRHQEVSSKSHFPPLEGNMLERGQRTGLGLSLREEAGRCMITCYLDLPWEYRDKRLQCLKSLGLQLPSWLAPSVKTWPNTSTLSAWSHEAHSGPCDPGEGKAGVTPAACPDTCSVFFVKGQVSPGWLSLPGEAQECLSSKDSTVPVFPLTRER